ncbi:MAG: tRNA (adenosine(37)-N6)-threonylcarbamoyltransferase complex dimerization subunit type 1 TsaB [Pseudomarimonas sp.]
MNLLAIETATEACSVALSVDGHLFERYEIAPRRHAELVLPWIDELLATAGIGKRQIDAIAVGRGPGAFTGVRLAVAVVQGIAMALDRPVLSISTLAALAVEAQGAPDQNVLAAIDARMGEVYVGAFRMDANGLPVALDHERLHIPSMPLLLPTGEHWIAVGSGFAAVDGALRNELASRSLRCDSEALPHASAVARLGLAAFARGEAISADQLEPAYLRDKVAQTLLERGKA